MGLLSFLKRTPGNASNAKAKAPPAAESPDTVAQARTRARQRLIGAAVLVIAGVIGFPLLFETQPRPLPVDTPVELKRDGTAAPVPAATPKPAAAKPAPLPPSVITESPADAGRELAASAPVAAPAPPVVAAVAPKPAPVERKPAEKPADKPAEKPAEKPSEKPAAKPAADSARAQALLDGKPAVAEAPGRFVVQVGAFAEVTAAREARHKVEKLGLKTYTQVVETSAGNRIRVRVGPFASRDEADRAAVKIKSAGLPSAILTL